MLALAPLLVLPLAAMPGAPQEPTRPSQTEVKSVEDLIARLEATEHRLRSLRARVELVFRIEMPGSEKPVESRATAGIWMRREPEGLSQRVNLDMQTPLAPLRLEMLRKPSGMWLHQSSELTGEGWFKMDRDLMAKLERAAELAGAESPIGGGAGQQLSRLIGPAFIAGLARDFDLVLAKPIEIDGVPCLHVQGKAKRAKDGESADQMPLGPMRPDSIDLYLGREDLVMRRMIQSRAGRPQLTVTMRQLELDQRIDAARFELVPPEGQRFRDIRDDPIARQGIELALEKLEAAERERAEAGEKGAESEAGARKKG